MTEREKDLRDSLLKAFNTALEDAKERNVYYSALKMASIMDMILSDYDAVLNERYANDEGEKLLYH